MRCDAVGCATEGDGGRRSGEAGPKRIAVGFRDRRVGAVDDAPLAAAVADTRQRALQWEAVGGPDAAAARTDARDVEYWERRRRGRHVRLWIVDLEARAAAWGRQDALYRLARYVRRPRHRVGDVPLLYSTGVPRLCSGGVESGVLPYPRDALVHRHERAPLGPLERAHVAGYVRALATARARLLHGAVFEDPAAAPNDPVPVPAESELRLWRVRHTVLCLAGPGEAPVRAEEFAATIVDDDGFPAAAVVGLRAHDGYIDSDGRRVHPAALLEPRGAAVLWDDYDRAEVDLGEPSAVADLLAGAAVRVWNAFSADARSAFR